MMVRFSFTLDEIRAHGEEILLLTRWIVITGALSAYVDTEAAVKLLWCWTVWYYTRNWHCSVSLMCFVIWRQIKPSYTVLEVCYSCTEAKYISAFWGFLKFCPLKDKFVVNTGIFSLIDRKQKHPKLFTGRKIINWPYLVLAVLQCKCTRTVWCWCVVKPWCDGDVIVRESFQFCFEKWARIFRWDTTEATLTLFTPFKTCLEAWFYSFTTLITVNGETVWFGNC